jgi:hypothetical protein
MLNSHMSNLGQSEGIGARQSCESFSPAGWSALSDPVVFLVVTCATAVLFGQCSNNYPT